jgi:hypothetical protein
MNQLKIRKMASVRDPNLTYATEVVDMTPDIRMVENRTRDGFVPAYFYSPQQLAAYSRSKRTLADDANVKTTNHALSGYTSGQTSLKSAQTIVRGSKDY